MSYRSRNHTYDTLIKTSKGTSEGSGGEPWGACCHSLRVAAVRGWPRSAGGRGLGWLWSAVGFGPRVAVVCEWPRSAGGHSPRVAVVCGWSWSGVAVVREWPWSGVAVVCSWLRSASGRGLRVPWSEASARAGCRRWGRVLVCPQLRVTPARVSARSPEPGPAPPGTPDARPCRGSAARCSRAGCAGFGAGAGAAFPEAEGGGALEDGGSV